MITANALRSDFPEFASTTKYPDSMVNFWLQIASLLTNKDYFGQPAPFVEVTAALTSAGAGYAVNDLLNVNGGTATQPAIIKVTAVDGNGGVTAFAVINAGQYTVVPANPVATTNTVGAGAGASFTLTWVSGPYTECDLAVELLACHNLVLEARANAEAANGAIPGVAQGAISSKSVGPVSVSYDTAIAATEGMGDLNLTIYGQRLARLIKAFGIAAIQIVGNRFNGASAWAGPIYGLGVNWDN